MNNNDPNCENYEVLISAMIDGEIALPEQDDLNQHLKSCRACQSQLRKFEKIDSAVESIAMDREQANLGQAIVNQKINGTASLVEPKPVNANAKTRTPWFSVWRLIPLAVAATLLICLAITALPTPQSATADQVLPEQILEPMKELHIIHQLQPVSYTHLTLPTILLV